MFAELLAVTNPCHGWSWLAVAGHGSWLAVAGHRPWLSMSIFHVHQSHAKAIKKNSRILHNIIVGAITSQHARTVVGSTT